jgi:hypothetical protein
LVTEYFLGIKNKFEINCPSTAKTFLIAPLANNLLTSAVTISAFSVEN